jgi:MFS family permease
MRRIKDGFRLLGQSWQVVRRRPVLVAVMALGMVATFVVAALLYMVAFRRAPEAADFRWPGILWLYPIILLAGIPGTLAGSAVVVVAHGAVEGKTVSIREGFEKTLRKFPQLIAWSVIFGVVGILMQLVAERLKLGGRIAALLAGVSWTVATMLVIPVLLFEDRGPFEALRRSAQLIKTRWGEGVTGYASIFGALVLVMVPVIVLGSLLGVFLDAVLGIVVMAAGYLATFFAAMTLQGVFTAAVYRYAVVGAGGGPFTTVQLESTFLSKEEKKRPARRAWREIGFGVLGIYLVVKVLEWTDVISIPRG